jgi:hypothetical protein
MGWNWVPTTAYTMESLDITKELDLYIRQYAAYYLAKATEGDDALSHILNKAGGLQGVGMTLSLLLMNVSGFR